MSEETSYRNRTGDQSLYFATVASILEAKAKKQPQAEAIVGDGVASINYLGLAEVAFGIAKAIAASDVATERERPRIGIVLPNGAACMVAMLGVTIVGEAAPFNPKLTAAEFESTFVATKIDALVVDSRYAGPASAVAHQLGLPVYRLTDEFRLAGLPTREKLEKPSPDDIALVLMTSGSTGSPKVVPLSHRNVCTSAGDVARSLDLKESDRCLMMWEQFHIGGLVDLLLGPLVSGGSIIATGGFDASEFFRLLELKSPTWYQAVPTTLGELIRVAELEGGDRPHTLRFIRAVAAALTPALMERVTAAFGVPVVRTLGMTEAGPLITSTSLPPAPQKPGSVGRPAGPDVKIFPMGGSSGEPSTTGQVGVKGPNVFKGYEGNDGTNADAFRDGWFLTGDLGYFDEDGDLFLTGRLKEQINRGGEKISPLEVEDALEAHPAVMEAAAFAVPHRTLGEDIVVAVVLDEDIDASLLREHLHSRLAPFKVPGRIIPLPELPRNPVGKVDRMALVAEASKEDDQTHGFVAARTHTEAFLVSLWSRELSLSSVGINQEFAALGGDSLSAMRILVAMESELGQPVPADVIENFTSISEIAERLKTAGLSIEALSSQNEGDLDMRAASTLAAVGHGLVYGMMDVEQLVEDIERASTKDEVSSVIDRITAYSPPAQIKDIAEATRGARPGAQAVPHLSTRKILGLKSRSFRLHRALQKDISASPGNGRWALEMVSESLWVYGDPDVPPAEKTLICGFSGNLQRLFLPTFRLLLHLDPARFDLMLLRDTGKSLFEEGLPEALGSASVVADYLDTFATHRGYARVEALGTSGGGLAAILSALRCGWPRVIAISPPGLSAHPSFELDLRDAAESSAAQNTDILIVHGANQRDADATRQLKELFTAAREQSDANYASHNVLNDALKRGELGPLVAGWYGA